MGNGQSRRLNDALVNGDFERVKELAARDGLTKEELLSLARAYNSERQKFQTEQLQTILSFCSNKKVETVFADIVKEGLWRAVGAFLKRGINKRFWRKEAVTEARERADDEDLSDILPYCTSDQFDRTFDFSVTRGIWSAVSELLKRQKKRRRASSAQLQSAFHGACISQTIEPRDLDSILSSCAAQDALRDECLKQAAIRGLWGAVHDIMLLKQKSSAGFIRRVLRALAGKFRRSPAHDLSDWAIKQVAERADENIIMEHFLPLFCLTREELKDVLLRELVKRSFWSAASKLLPQNQSENDYTDMQQVADQTLPRRSSSISTLSTYDEHFDFILREAVERKKWGVVKELLKKGLSNSDQMNLVTARVKEAAGMRNYPLDASLHGPKDHMKSVLDLLEATSGNS